MKRREVEKEMTRASEKPYLFVEVLDLGVKETDLTSQLLIAFGEVMVLLPSGL